MLLAAGSGTHVPGLWRPFGGMGVSGRGFTAGKWEERDRGVLRDTVLSAGETEAGKGRWEEELLYLALWFSAAKVSPQDECQ